MNLIKKSAIIGLSIAIAGISFVPAPAQAKKNNGLGKGLEHKIQNFWGIDNDIDFDISGININMGNTTSSDNNVFKNTIKPARTTYMQDVKQANKAYKNAVKIARNKFRASIKIATDASASIVALKIYLSDLLTALKQKAEAKENAIQKFINSLTINP